MRTSSLSRFFLQVGFVLLTACLAAPSFAASGKPMVILDVGTTWKYRYSLQESGRGMQSAHCVQRVISSQRKAGGVEARLVRRCNRNLEGKQISFQVKAGIQFLTYHLTSTQFSQDGEVLARFPLLKHGWKQEGKSFAKQSKHYDDGSGIRKGFLPGKGLIEDSAIEEGGKNSAGVFLVGFWTGATQQPDARVPIPGGEFTMGYRRGSSNERPPRKVRLKAFLIDRYEVTNARYAACVRAKKCRPRLQNLPQSFRAPLQPVVGVSWKDAANYCRWKKGSLPTEAQWERAALGKAAAYKPPPRRRRSIRAWERCSKANFGNRFSRRCKRLLPRRTLRVGLFSPNSFGLYDMAGNAWEWVADCYHSRAYRKLSRNNPHYNPSRCRRRVLRGGAWTSSYRQLRPTYRRSSSPKGTYHRPKKIIRYPHIGFRCVYPAPPQSNRSKGTARTKP